MTESSARPSKPLFARTERLYDTAGAAGRRTIWQLLYTSISSTRRSRMERSCRCGSLRFSTELQQTFELWLGRKRRGPL